MKLSVMYDLSKTSKNFSQEILDELNEYVDYQSTGMRVVVTEVLKTFRNRIERGEEIKYLDSDEILNIGTFKPIVLDNFGEEIFEDVFEVELD